MPDELADASPSAEVLAAEVLAAEVLSAEVWSPELSSTEVRSDGPKIGDLAARAGLKRVHVLAWRDLDDAEAGGSELHADAIMRRWAEAGLDVTLRTSAAMGHPPVARRNGYDVIRRGGRYDVFARAVVAELAGRHGRGRDALVEIWNGVPWLSPLWARGPHVTWLHHVHGPMWKMALPFGLAQAGELFERRVAPPLYRRSPVVTLSDSSRDELVDQLGFRRDRVHVISPGIDARFTPGGERAAHPLVVAVGRLMPVKRFDRLIAAIAPLKSSIPALELIIVGEGAERDRLHAQIDALDAASWITLPGRLDDDELVALYRRAWLVASASVAEGWGMTLTEAAACATPSVVTDIAGHRDAVAGGKAGVLAAPGEIGAAIGALLTDDARRTALAASALDHARSLTWEATATRTMMVLAAEAERQSRRAGTRRR